MFAAGMNGRDSDGRPQLDENERQRHAAASKLIRFFRHLVYTKR